MLKSLKIRARLIGVFGLLILFILLIGGINLYNMNHLADLTNKMYKHPFAVSNAVLSIEVNILSMHRGMKDVTLAKNPEVAKQAAATVAEDEKKVLAQFEIVYDRFLGDKKMVDDAHQAFLNWRPLRQEIIKLMAQGKREEAVALEHEKETVMVGELYEKVETLNQFAQTKGVGFFKMAVETRDLVFAETLGLLVVVVGLALVLAFVVSRSITVPLVHLNAVITRIEEQGDFTLRADIAGKDEVAQSGQALDKLLATLQPAMRNILSEAETLSAAAAQLSASTTELSRTADEVNGGIEGQAAAITQANQNIIELTQSIQDVSAGARQVHQAAGEADKAASNGVSAMQNTKAAITKISESSGKIVGIINVITEIANQTNLLSLNAAIEAAKAGESGKGFAVVADEVRVLADRSNTQVEQIRNLIEISSQNVTEGTQVVETTAEYLTQITTQVQQIGQQIASIADELTAQEQRADEVSKATEEINEISETNASAMNQVSVAVTEIEKTSEELSGMAEKLKDLVQVFKV
ncbi:MAG: HAMP domain-containing methyl-accepting chemotaxis protein [bacterium]|nr:HAMP domain-containing methyl-accepting chemotaxis protein [bacterium]